MDIPINQPSITLSDGSKNDDSIRQQGVTITASNGATVNANSGNGFRDRFRNALFLTLAISVVCDILVCGLIVLDSRMMDAKADTRLMAVQDRIEKSNRDMEGKFAQANSTIGERAKEAERIAREGNIWLLRHDILKHIDIYEAKGIITEKEFHRLQEEYRHYREIGGNYDVEERWEQFKAKIYGTHELTMRK